MYVMPFLIETDTISPKTVCVNDVPLGAPLTWLKGGWDDFLRCPINSLLYGGMMSGLGGAIVTFLLSEHLYQFIIPLCLGFVLIAPVTVVGMYRGGALLEQGEKPSFKDMFNPFGVCTKQIAMFGLLLALVFFMWIRLSLLVFMLFLDGAPYQAAGTELFTLSADSLMFLLTENIIAGLFAIAAFSISVVSAPMLTERETNAMKAIIVSWTAVTENPKPMALWALIILASVGFGFMTFGIGLVVTLPVLAFASRRAYKECVSIQE